MRQEGGVQQLSTREPCVHVGDVGFEIAEVILDDVADDAEVDHFVAVDDDVPEARHPRHLGGTGGREQSVLCELGERIAVRPRLSETLLRDQVERISSP